ncbi:leucine-rich repeat domain-containing protein [Candidatus Falkowbacteria bacterium]|nr:leucine-rich repeat domain-containing protein [Candidatus Falkowbacteria bacterium]
MKKLLLLIAIISLTGCSISYAPKPENKFGVGVEVNVKSALDLSGEGLTQIDESVFEKTYLLELNVSNNNLTGSLPAEIAQLSKLKVLNASNNAMTGVPAEIGQLTNLQVLDLSNNQLTGLPNELGNLKNLQTLNLSGNNYSQQDLDVIMKGLPASVEVIK